MSQSEQAAPLPVAAQPLANSVTRLIPPWAYVIAGIVSAEVGAGFAKQLFDTVGTSGVVLIRTSVAALLFLILWRPKWRGYRPAEYIQLAFYGAMMATMMLAFYAAISRIPLGIAVACSFLGPLGLALVTSRKIIDLIWVGAALIGIVLISPLTNTTLDLVGLMFALLSGAAWAAFMLLSGPITRKFPHNAGLALAMSIAALTALPFGASGVLNIVGSVSLIAQGVFVALLSSALPFAMQYHALKQLPARVYGILSSLEPVAAALVGFILLHEALEAKEIVGIGLVTMAAVMTTRSSPPTSIDAG
jgi:inner membrane transporter RhtA